MRPPPSNVKAVYRPPGNPTVSLGRRGRQAKIAQSGIIEKPAINSKSSLDTTPPVYEFQKSYSPLL